MGTPLIPPPMTAKLSAEELERLEALAKAATPGPWTWTPQELEKERDGKFVPVTAANIDGPFVFETGEGYMGCDDANAAYIAAANPSVLLRLTAQVREAEARWKDITKRLQAAVAADNLDWAADIANEMERQP